MYTEILSGEDYLFPTNTLSVHVDRSGEIWCQVEPVLTQVEYVKLSEKGFSFFLFIIIIILMFQQTTHITYNIRDI